MEPNVLRITKLRRTVRSIKRYREILRILLKYGFEDILNRLRIEAYLKIGKKGYRVRKREIIPMSQGERIRHAFEELGPTFIKLGQMLGTRPDLIPMDYIKEFRKLQDKVVPFPYDRVKGIIETEFGEPVEMLFPFFNEIPQAAASMAQVHRATAKNGDQVVVKVQRPGIQSTIRSDMEILSDLAHLIVRRLPESEFYDPVGIVDQFNRWLRNELDFYLEGRNIDRFRRHFEKDDTVYVPKVHWELTTSRVLTMEYIEGINILDLERLEQAGLNRKIIARNGVRAVLKQIFEHGFFHGDPHPGNLFVLEGNVIAPLDFGLMGRLDDEFIESIGDILKGVHQKDTSRVVRLLLDIGIVKDEIKMQSFRQDVGEFIDRYYQVPLYQLNMVQIIDETMELISRHRIRLPRDLYLIGKALVIMEGVGRTLDPEFDMFSMVEPYIQQILVRKWDPHRLIRDASRVIEGFKDLIDSLPENVKQILLKVRKGELGINLRHQGLDHLIRELDKSTNRLSFSLIIAALIIASTLIMQLDRSPHIFGLPAFGLIGYLIAAVLGLWLVIAILRSGKL